MTIPRHDRLNHTAEYCSWNSMKQCCYNKKNPGYKNYGGRKIKICKQWRESFETFLTDMGEKPSPDLSLDRINNDGDYEPGNCKWSTAKEQARNRRPRKNGRPRLYRDLKPVSLVMPTSLYRWIKKHAIPGCRSFNATAVELLMEARKKKSVTKSKNGRARGRP